MESFGNKYISWYKDDREIKQNLQMLDLQHGTDVPTVLFWRRMAKTIMEINKEDDKKLASAHDLVPHAVSLWNKCKGGQDVVSRQLKNVKVDFRNLKPRAYIIIRQIMTQLLNAHLVHRIYCFALKRRKKPKDSSYVDIKKQLNKIKSFSDSLEEMFEVWTYKKLCEKISSKKNSKKRFRSN
jgi:hypothetical protein